MKYPLKASLVLAAIASLAAVAYGAQKSDQETALPVPKITLTQAVSTAEQHVNGQARRAEYEKTRAGLVYDVEVASGAKLFDVRVDPEKGTVVSSKEQVKSGNDEHDEID